MSNETKRLATISDKLSSAKTELAKAQGKMDGFTEQLKEFNCTDVKQARKLIDELDTSILENEEELEKGLTKLEKQVKEIEDENTGS